MSLQLYFESFVCCIKTGRLTGRTGGSNGISEIVAETNQISSCLTIIDVVDPIKNIPFGDGFLPATYGNLGDGLWQDGKTSIGFITSRRASASPSVGASGVPPLKPWDCFFFQVFP